jgi:hypothetical protein
MSTLAAARHQWSPQAQQKTETENTLAGPAGDWIDPPTRSLSLRTGRASRWVPRPQHNHRRPDISGRIASNVPSGHQCRWRGHARAGETGDGGRSAAPRTVGRATRGQRATCRRRGAVSHPGPLIQSEHARRIRPRTFPTQEVTSGPSRIRTGDLLRKRQRRRNRRVTTTGTKCLQDTTRSTVRDYPNHGGCGSRRPEVRATIGPRRRQQRALLCRHLGHSLTAVRDRV